MFRYIASLILVAALCSASSAQVYVGRGGVHVGYGGGVHVGGGYGVRVGGPYYGGPIRTALPPYGYRYGYGVRYAAPYPFYGYGAAPSVGIAPSVGVYGAPVYLPPQVYVP